MADTLLDKKVDHWEHQLLDMGKRNKLIHYRETKRATLRLIEPSFSELYERIAVNEETLSFQRTVDKETDIRVFSLLALMECLSAPLPVTIGDIKTSASIAERQITLRSMRNKARLSLEEQGSNILYLSFAFLEWSNGKGASAQRLKSPLLLVPAVLTIEALNAPYTLSKHEDDIVVNPTLTYFLRTEYGIELPPFDVETETLDGYLTKIEEMADQRGWRILREVSLGLLSFQKIAMYNDLLNNEARIKSNPIIRAMSGDAQEANHIPADLQSVSLDSVHARACYQVMSADSSQQDAIMYSKNNVSYVMQGPPGTGKSQTITNIIAEALADEKKVLFVSEKMAALQVVYKRLQEVDLADFCLPLHSNKANKKEIVDQIGQNLDLRYNAVKSSALNNLDELSDIRQALNQYATQLHQCQENLDMSCYEVYSELERVRNAPTASFEFTSPLTTTQSKLQSCLSRLKDYQTALEQIDYYIQNNPWDGLTCRTVSFEHIEKMRKETTLLQEELLRIVTTLNAIPECNEICLKLDFTSIESFIEVLTSISQIPSFPNHWILAEDISSTIRTANEAQNIQNRLFTLQKEVEQVFHKSINHYNYNEWKSNIIHTLNDLYELPFFELEKPGELISHIDSAKQLFAELHSAMSIINHVFSSVEQLLGLRLSSTSESHTMLEALLQIIQKNTCLPKEWFSGDMKAIKALTEEAQAMTKELQNVKSKLLEEWEIDALSLQYTPILQRFKTDYTSIFKIFNPQYHRDLKQIKSLSKTVRKKTSNDAAVQFLSALKSFHDKEKWFEERKTEFIAAFSTYNDGMNTDWGTLLAAISDVQQVVENLNGTVPPQLIKILSTDHTQTATALAELLPTSSVAFKKITCLLTNQQVAIMSDSASKNYDDAIITINTYIVMLDQLSKQMDALRVFLCNETEPLERVFSAIDSLNEYRNTKSVFDRSSDQYRSAFAPMYLGETTDWNSIIDLLNKVRHIKQSTTFALVSHLVNTDAETKHELLEASLCIQRAYHASLPSFLWIVDQFGTDSKLKTLPLAALSQRIQACLQQIDMLSGWVDYQEAREDCYSQSLRSYIEAIEKTAQFSDIKGSFLKGFYQQWLSAAYENLDAVRRFRKSTQDDRIQRFTTLDDLQLTIAQKRIRAKLIRKLPTESPLQKATDEISILKKERNKKRNIMPLRKLFKQIPNLLMTLKPCFMMSPLSVSHFLEAEVYHFDLVIFDEASQIFPEDAIGAIFRGSQVIIAGDTKQLPPTHFFTASTNNSDGDYDIDNEDDMDEVIADSILEEAAGALPNKTLLWHYRSKQENLIAFSNREIYKNDLITFPSSITNQPDMGVEYIYVEDGCYEGHGKSCNIQEAKKCVMLVLKHIQNHPNRSLGIIAFSQKQQTAIENAINDFRTRMPQHEWFFDENNDEPFFVKNLENVQGDERDTIIFSICYAKDSNGRMYMRFGPLGQAGGERRLNVAITRAKCNIKLVGSILPTDIDLTRTNAEGVRMLRSYIEFARTGNAALAPVKKEMEQDVHDEFCDMIASFLENNGYTVQKGIGCSDYKIDIAIENPNAAGEYVAGIECDGLSYIHAKTVRDRDHLRKAILKNMGWNMYRLWSTEWCRNPEAEGNALLGFIQSLLDKDGNVIHSVQQGHENIPPINMDDIISNEKAMPVTLDKDNPYGFAYYEEANERDAKHGKSSDHFTRIGETALFIVGIEQPIHKDLLYKRMVNSFMTDRVTQGVRDTIDSVIKTTLKDKLAVDKHGFIWLKPLNPLSPITVRIPKKWDTPRAMEYISTNEVAKAMSEIVKHSYGLLQDDLASECAHVFGFDRKGVKIKAKTDDALSYLVRRDLIKIVDDKVQAAGGIFHE